MASEITVYKCVHEYEFAREERKYITPDLEHMRNCCVLNPTEPTEAKYHYFFRMDLIGTCVKCGVKKNLREIKKDEK